MNLSWIRKSTLASLAAIVLTAWSAACHAAEGRVVTLETRSGVKIVSHYQAAEHPVATVLLFTGGSGGIGLKDGKPTSGNFLLRSRQRFLALGFNVFSMGRPSDRSDLDGGWRSSAAHAEDIRQVVHWLRQEGKLPVWLIGTSMGTISATIGAIHLGDEIAGAVLTSSITTFRMTGAPASQALDEIRVPVLVVHHRKDACVSCQAHEVSWIMKGLKNTPVKKLVLIDSGENPTGDPCEPWHWHGYPGAEDEVIGLIGAWIKAPSP